MEHINHLTGVHIDLHLLRGALNQTLVEYVGQCTWYYFYTKEYFWSFVDDPNCIYVVLRILVFLSLYELGGLKYIEIMKNIEIVKCTNIIVKYIINYIVIIN